MNEIENYKAQIWVLKDIIGRDKMIIEGYEALCADFRKKMADFERRLAEVKKRQKEGDEWKDE
jgi:hypothetical protein